MGGLCDKDGKISVAKVAGRMLRAATVVFCFWTKGKTPACTELLALIVKDFSWKQRKCNSSQVIKISPQTLTLRSGVALMH